MSSPSAQLSLRKIAGAYGVTGQAMHALQRRHGLTREQLAEPDAVFEVLLTSYDSPLRKRLAETAKRQEIAERLHEINLSTFRSDAPSAENKISSIL